jgi:aspartyl-tRNA(Asn)/glutamyl-tRNA(Gln) amidotransferase subunit A
MIGPTLAALAVDLDQGRTTSRALVEACLAAIRAPEGEGAATFIAVDAAAAMGAAQAMDALRQAGAAPSRFAGIPISIKDLFDIQGEVTRAGSRVREDGAPATADAVAVARLRRMGFVLIGRTNMTEFAYSGIGLNPHYGTPRNSWDRAAGRAPGGSSSGAAISLTDHMAHAALGTDTGGSCRIPAAFNGLVGFKPTARRVPLSGVVPLSPTLDSVGSLGRSVACCAAVDAIVAQEGVTTLAPRDVAGLRLAVPTTIALDTLDGEVARAFEAFVRRLSGLGARLVETAVPEFAEMSALGAKGGFAAAESYAAHRTMLAERGERYDPRVAARIRRGAEQSAADYIDLHALRAGLIARASARLAGFDALVLPTVAIVPPRLAELADDADFTRLNLLALRNCSLINLIDGCAVSLPITAAGEAPVGAMIAGLGGADRDILSIASAIEARFVQGEAH